MGEAIARSLLYERSIASEVASAGTEALDGMEATDGAKITARKLVLDLSEHRSRAVSGDLVAMADLVVAMEPRHVVDLVNEFDAALARTYTLPELADLVRRSPRHADESFSAWLGRISEGRDHAAVLSATEIADPIGRSMRRYRQAAQQIAGGLETLIDYGMSSAGQG